jgi:hypothetical protein
VIGLSVADWLRLVPDAGEHVTVYVVIAAPPFDVGAVNVTMADPSPAPTETIVGLPGTVLPPGEVEELPLEHAASRTRPAPRRRREGRRILTVVGAGVRDS